MKLIFVTVMIFLGCLHVVSAKDWGFLLTTSEGVSWEMGKPRAISMAVSYADVNREVKGDYEILHTISIQVIRSRIADLKKFTSENINKPITVLYGKNRIGMITLEQPILNGSVEMNFFKENKFNQCKGLLLKYLDSEQAKIKLEKQKALMERAKRLLDQ